MSVRKFAKLERLSAVLREDIIFNVKCVYCKMCNLSCYILLALRLSARKSEIKKKNSGDVNWSIWRNIKTLYNAVCPK